MRIIPLDLLIVFKNFKGRISCLCGCSKKKKYLKLSPKTTFAYGSYNLKYADVDLWIFFFFKKLNILFLMSSISRVSLARGIKVCISSEAASGSSTVLGLDSEQQHLARVWLWADNFSHSKVLLLSSSSNKNKITVDCKAAFYSAPNQLPTVFSSRCLMLPWKPLDLCEGMSLVLSWQLVWFVRATRSNLPKQQRNAESQSLMCRSEGWHVVSWLGFAELFRKGRSWMQTVNILMSGSTDRIKHCWAALSVSTCPVPYLNWLLRKTPVHWDCGSPGARLLCGFLDT